MKNLEAMSCGAKVTSDEMMMMLMMMMMMMMMILMMMMITIITIMIKKYADDEVLFFCTVLSFCVCYSIFIIWLTFRVPFVNDDCYFILFNYQEIGLYNLLTIGETLRYFGRIHGMETVYLNRRINFLLNLLSLPEENRIVDTLR